MSRRDGLWERARDTALGFVAGAAVSLLLFGLSAAVLVALVDSIGRRHGL